MGEDRSNNYISTAIIVILVLFVLLPFYFLKYMPFDPAELENLQASWLVHTGLMPYRDFFEHHGPLFFYIAAPQFIVSDVASNYQTAINQIFLNRTAFWILSLSIAFISAILAKLWKGKTAGYTCMAFILSTAMFSRTGIEIHPETLGVFFWILTVLFAYLSISNRVNKNFVFFSGVFLGATIMTIQEMVLIIPWVFLALILANTALTTPHKFETLSAVLVFTIGLTTVILGAIIIFYRVGSLSVFLDQMVNIYNYPLNPIRNLIYLTLQQPLMILVFLYCGIQIISDLISRKPLDKKELFFLILSLGMTFTLVLIQAAHQQYFLFLIPILGILAAGCLDRFASMVINV